MAQESDNKIDLASIHDRYEQERQKRLHAGGIEQFVALKDFPELSEDPWTPKHPPREAVSEDVEVLIVGGGFAGLMASYHLTNQGITSFRVVDKAGDFGGVWYWNRYPGIRCDTEAYVYMPLLEEMGYVPSEKYATGQEIREYAQSIAKKISLHDKAFFHTKVTGMKWHEESARWQAETDRGDAINARFVINANGQLDAPRLPRIEGMEKFKGKIIHAARWDYDYTKGDQVNGGMVGLKDKKVAIVGTACTGVQAIPHLADTSEHLYVFQRTPSAVDYRHNKKTDPAWAESLQPGWHQERIRNFTEVTAGNLNVQDMVDDGWTDMMRKLKLVVASNSDQQMDDDQADIADAQRMEELRRLTDEVVKDRETADALKAYYGFWCKRPTFSDDYLDTFNRDNVALVDMEGKSIEAMTENSIVFGGKEHEVDCVVFASGYEFGTTHTSRAGYDPVGRHGVVLSEKWRDGLRTFRGMHTNGFPNWLLSGLTQAASGPNFMHVISEQINHAVYVIKTCIDRDIRTIDAELEAENDWCQSMIDHAGPKREYLSHCTPSYMTNEGAIGTLNSHNITEAIWGGGLPTFLEWLHAFRENGELEGLIVEQNSK